MKKFWRNKWFRVGALVLGAVLLVFFWNSKTVQERLRVEIPENGDGLGPILAFSVDTSPAYSWHRGHISLYIQETDFGGPNDQGAGSPKDLFSCRYIVNGQERSRACNTAFSVSVGLDPANNCSQQGTNNPAEGVQYTCAVGAYAIDHTGNETDPANRPSRLYGIDWTPPLVSEVYGQEVGVLDVVMEESFEYHVAIRENESRVVGCGFFVKKENETKYQNKGAMVLSQPCQRDCVASFSHLLSESGEYSIRAVCEDEAGNYGFGQTQTVSLNVNHNPEVQICWVRPAQGNKTTQFVFEVSAQDPDDGTLLYEWDFGDGEKSSLVSPTHQYGRVGTYTPRVRVSDEQEGEALCFTAWVTVGELLGE